MESTTRTEQIISQFHLKAIHIILHSRIPSYFPIHQQPSSSSSKRDRWFNLALPDHPSLPSFRPPILLDVLLSPDVVLERWSIHHHNTTSHTSTSPSRLYKRSLILLRSLYSFLRLLPAHRPFKLLSSSNLHCPFSLSFRISDDGDLLSPIPHSNSFSFPPVETQFGYISVSVSYRNSLDDFDLTASPLIPTRIITDYVGSPAADPMRAFPSTSFPLRDSTPGVALFNRPHSWTGQNLSPPGFSDRHLANYHLHKSVSVGVRRGSLDFGVNEHKLSPPFSPSTTPSPPVYGNSPLRNRLNSDTTPVSIPRSSLPPPSPRSTRLVDHSSGESPSGRSFRKIEGFRTAELPSSLPNYTSQKGVRDDVGQMSGIFSSTSSPRAVFSRSSSRLSSQDLPDDTDLFFPFAIDNLDLTDTPNRNMDGKDAPGPSQPFMSPRKSQDAAVGVLVQMLGSAPPLRQDPNSSQSAKSEYSGDVGSSSFFMSRKTSDALEELRSYREMKDMLLSHSGSALLNASKQNLN